VASSLKRLRLKAAPNGTIRITGFLDTTGYGGWAGFVQALRTRPPADADTTPSAIFRQGNVFAFNVSVAGLAPPGQTLVFPACVSVAGCSGTEGGGVSFLRKGGGDEHLRREPDGAGADVSGAARPGAGDGDVLARRRRSARLGKLSDVWKRKVRYLPMKSFTARGPLPR